MTLVAVGAGCPTVAVTAHLVDLVDLVGVVDLCVGAVGQVVGEQVGGRVDITGVARGEAWWR
jgi:hypothetical protein